MSTSPRVKRGRVRGVDAHDGDDAPSTAASPKIASASCAGSSWGPYLSERAWGTVREDYSANGDAWSYFPHDHARSRAYRWSEDGLGGRLRSQRRLLCLALALWNEKDPILKERAFGLTGPEGNHGEDVKEVYYYEDATPTSSYLRYVYKYPQRALSRTTSSSTARSGREHARSRARARGSRRLRRRSLLRRHRRVREARRRTTS